MQCAKCSVEKQPGDFYAGDRTCKTCRCARVRENRREKLEQYRAYEKRRASMPHRVEAREAYRATDAGQIAVRRAHARYNRRYRERRQAAIEVGNAVRDGRLKKMACWECGAAKVEAHHPAYDQPLHVVWLCNAHHRQIHSLFPRTNHDDR